MSTETCRNCGEPLASGETACPACGVTHADGRTASPARNPWEQLLDRLSAAARPRYRVVRLLGYGGMAGVYLADEPRLGRKVAIKVMSPALMMDPGLVARFTQEARITAQLAHPNIATIYDVDEREGLHYFVMEYVAGRTLGQVMSATRGEPLPITIALHWLTQAASALTYAHRAGVVHRDVKPGNIMLTSDGNIRITDFGIAKVADEPSLTRTGFLVGTPAYMSPEQCSSGTVAGPSDQYALGVVGYELLTGRPPFTGATMAVVQAHVSSEPTPVSELRPEVPPEVSAAIGRMLAKNAADRYPSPSSAVADMGARALGDEHELRPRLAALATGALAERPEPRPPLALTLERASVSAGDELPLRPALGGWRTDEPLTWSTSDPRIATVDADGNLVAHRPGLVTVTASTGQYRATALLTVLAPDTPVPMMPSEATPVPTPPPAPTPIPATPAPAASDPVTPVPDAAEPEAEPAAPEPEPAWAMPAEPKREPPRRAPTPVPGERGTGIGGSRMLIAAAAVAVLAGGVFAVRAMTADGDGPAEAGSGAIALPPMSPPPVAATPPATRDSLLVGAGDPDTATTVASAGDSARVAPPAATPPPATPPPAPPAAPAPGRLRIAGDLPSNAEVVIRGGGTVRRWTGQDLSLPPGRYAVEASAAGYRSASADLRVESDRTATWTPDLERIPVQQPPAAPPATPPPPPPPPPATPPATPPAVDEEAAAEQVRGVIQGFTRALQARDMDALTRQYPGVRGAWLNDWRGFYTNSDVRDLTAQLARVADLTIEGTTARAVFDVRVEFSDARTRQRPTFTFDATFTRTDSGWSMTALQQTR